MAALVLFATIGLLIIAMAPGRIANPAQALRADFHLQCGTCTGPGPTLNNGDYGIADGFY
jgi:hypothetical protein